MDLGVLGYYRQMILRSSDVDERDVFYKLFEHFSTPPVGRLSARRFAPLSTLRAFEALALSFSHSGLALQRKSNHHLRGSGSTLVGRLREDLLKC
jgi:hypothetical protein